MKKLLLIVGVCFVTNSFSQKVYSTEKDIFETNKITFYGFDFSDFQLADYKRIGQDLKKYIFVLTGFFEEYLPEKKLKKLINKVSIVYNYTPTITINKKIKPDDLGAAVRHTINKDSIQSFIDKYQISEKDGIGYVIIFECFDNASKTVSAYQVFFDIATKKILLSDYVRSFSRAGYNRLSDWNEAAFIAVNKLTQLYKARDKKYKKG